MTMRAVDRHWQPDRPPDLCVEAFAAARTPTLEAPDFEFADPFSPGHVRPGEERQSDPWQVRRYERDHRNGEPADGQPYGCATESNRVRTPFHLQHGRYWRVPEQHQAPGSGFRRSGLGLGRGRVFTFSHGVPVFHYRTVDPSRSSG